MYYKIEAITEGDMFRRPVKSRHRIKSRSLREAYKKIRKQVKGIVSLKYRGGSK